MESEYNKIEKYREVIDTLQEHGLEVVYVQNTEVGLALILIGRIKRDIREQLWVKIGITNNNDVAAFFSDGRVVVTDDEFVSVNDMCINIKEFID